ncbi:MAG: winged helix DNA-binding domain-containing protein [Oscillospiraceae bacterium]|jgi:hypothetical protein|nr:winged helix DNA-binding domain-containing protein [Oscillospiraceae bacterium]
MDIDAQTLLAIRMRRLHIIDRATSHQITSDLMGMQAQFANNPKNALRIRATDYHAERWSDSLVKIWSFRHTLHDVLSSEVGLYLSARGKPETWENSWGIPADRMRDHAARFMDMLEEGVSTRSALKRRFAQAGVERDELERVFYGWGGLLYEMNQRGMIAMHPDTEKRFVPLENVEWMDKYKARAILFRRYFQTYGPASVYDLAAFMGLRMSEVNETLRADFPPLESVEYNGQTLYYLGDIMSNGESPSPPDCRFLTGFDAIIMGYKDRSFIIDERNKRDLITNTGIVFPSVLLNGRLRARWKLSGDTLNITPFDKLTKTQRARIERAARKAFMPKRRPKCEDRFKIIYLS